MSRFILHTGEAGRLAEDLGTDVRSGLTATPKRLSCRHLYDAEGSRLFEEICTVPEYYVTRAETEILEARAPRISAALPHISSLVELGSGNSQKTRLLIAAFLADRNQLEYVPVDISREVLETSSRALLDDFPALSVTALATEYAGGLAWLAERREAPRLVLWLGSNIGNFDRAGAIEFLRTVRGHLGPEDRMLLGVDLKKDRAVLEAAYDDAQGVTARFNLNLLARINRDLGGHFDLAHFEHVARYDEPTGAVKMYLRSRTAQTIRIDTLDLDVSFANGELIHTEDSFKYSRTDITATTRAADFEVEEQFTDEAQRFTSNLLRPI